jgi:hypothetical protein
MESNDQNVWFFIKDSQQQGPVCLFELQKLIEQRILTGETFVWNKSMSSCKWQKVLNFFRVVSLNQQESICSLINLKQNRSMM